jgi:pimeloyl-ACP methyl ester carboxylesterase
MNDAPTWPVAGLELLAYVGWGALGALVALAVVYGTLLASIALLYVRRGIWSARARSGAFGRLGLVGVVLREAAAQLRIVGWAALRRGAGHLEAREAWRGRPVVLIHGIAADGTSMWALRRALDAAGRPTWSPHLGRMFRSIEAYAERLTPALRAALAAHPDADGIDIVCHSMGGIILRACLAAHPDIAVRVKNVVSIASPHEGTVIATGVPITEARQLHRGAPWLLALPTLSALVPGARITTIASRDDAVVYPCDTSRVAGARWHELDHLGHAELLVAPAVLDLVVSAVS